jgi:hypothetical protein
MLMLILVLRGLHAGMVTAVGLRAASSDGDAHCLAATPVRHLVLLLRRS